MKHVKWLAPVLLILGLWGYHFLAANQAERDIDEAIQEQASSDTTFSIHYSDINVHPFSGDIEFNDLNFIDNNRILRSTKIVFDLTYSNFLSIYFRGAESGLRNLDHIISKIESPSAVIRHTLTEYKAQNISLTYRGNFFDMLVHFVQDVPFEFAHQLNASADGFRYSRESSSWGTFDADSTSIQVDIPAGAASVLHGDQLFLKAAGLRWHPPTTVQEKYGFFIRGFEYDPENLPVDSLYVQLQQTENPGGCIINTVDLFTDLFHARGTAELTLREESFQQAQLENGQVLLVESSRQFRNFLDNAQSLLGISPPDSTEPVILFSGPLADPAFRLNN